MRKPIVPSASASLSLIVLCGCGADLSQTARSAGATDLECPTYVSTYRGQDGIYVAGCGRWVEYSCFYAQGNPVCARRSDPKPLPENGTPALTGRVGPAGPESLRSAAAVIVVARLFPSPEGTTPRSKSRAGRPRWRRCRHGQARDGKALLPERYRD